MKILYRTTITVLLILLTFSIGHSRVRFVPIEEMPAMSDFVVVGTVVDSSCRWGERGLMIFTDYTITIEERIPETSDRAIVMSFAGGTVGDRSILVTHTPQLNVGETYVLFGLANEKASVPVVGHAQGVFRVLKDGPSGKEFIVDYNGYLLEKLDNGKIIRGPLVDLDVRDRLVMKMQKEEKKVDSPKPVVRDAYGQEIPQEGAVFAERKCRQRGNPLVKSIFIDFAGSRMTGEGR